MRARFFHLLLAALAASRAVAGEPAPEVELAVIVHPSCPARGIGSAQLEAIFTSAERAWSDGRSIVAFNYPPEDPLRVLFERVVLRMTPEQVSRFWVDQRVRGGPRPPRQVVEAGLALRLVAKLPGAIAYVPRGLVDDTVRVVARVRDGKLMEADASSAGGSR